MISINNQLNIVFNSPATQWLHRRVAGLFFSTCFFILINYSGSSCLAGSKPPKPNQIFDPPVFEVYPHEESMPVRELPLPEDRIVTELPKMAIIIDDIGYDLEIVEKFLSLETDLTFSIFPHCPFQDIIIKKIKEKGREIMLHLPMEPLEYPAVNPGSDALMTSMSPDVLSKQLEKNLNMISGIKGVNNHMGSKMTIMPTQIYQILSIIKAKNLFFIDSFTNPLSICRSSARLLQIPFASRDVFLDHIQKSDVIKKQIHNLIHIAETYGEAVGIGHPHKVTYEILYQELPVLKRKVQIVPASQVVHTIG